MASFDGNENECIQRADGVMSTLTAQTAAPDLSPRGYQIEMFEASMKENVIVAMETGSGKTMVARLRIEAELQRTPTKRIWFTTPNVLLAHQQHRFFRSQLPSYSFRLITGADSVDFWSTQQVWNSVLANQHGIVSTPEVLRSALQHGFVSLSNISLLIFDEAHHCMKKDPTNQIMQLWYHPLKHSHSCSPPAILGLTASPIVRNRIEAMQKLEQNLDAACRSPTLNIEEYQSFVHMPRIIPLDFTLRHMLPSGLLPILGRIVQEYAVVTDPVYLRLKQNTSLSDTVRLEEIIKKNETPILKDIKRLYNHAVHLQEQIGAWAADRYITTCVTLFSDSLKFHPLISARNRESIHLHTQLSPIFVAIANFTSPSPTTNNLSGKALALIRYLVGKYESGDAGIIFVERRPTAWALRELILSLKEPTFWKPFALVGINSVFGRGLADLIDEQMPQSELDRFHEGSLNLCIATSVLEEGIDVQACNLVICFDDSQNVKSFIQRRGRARHPGSRYVIMQGPTSEIRFSRYQALEDEMKAAYSDLDRHMRTLDENECVHEDSDQYYYVQSTGANLRIDQARGHLAHFCNLLPHRDGRSHPAPIYIMEGIPGEQVSCRVILPSSLPPHLQVMKSSTWRTEKMAKKEAAFLAYVQLHKNGLLSDHLLPHANEAPEKTTEAMCGLYNAAPIVNPWWATRGNANKFYKHQIHIQHPEMALPPLVLLLPVTLCNPIMVKLFSEVTATATIRISSQQQDLSYDQTTANEATKLLFRIVWQRRLGAVNLNQLAMPYYVIPDILAKSMESWIESVKVACPAPMFDFRMSGRSSYLIQKRGEPRPYIYNVPAPSTEEITSSPSYENLELDLLRISKQINFLLPLDSPVSMCLKKVPRKQAAADCLVIGLHPEYAVCMTYIPSIMYVVEIAIRTHLARLGPLAPIGLGASDEILLSSALTAPGVAQSDYQRLEFIGDSVLKYWTTVHVFCLNPYMTENMLTVARDRLINNARLLRATRSIGLEAYFTTTRFSAQKWSLDQIPESQEPRSISSKTLADLIEAVIGVAYASVENVSMGANSHLIQRSLQLFLPEMQWQIPFDLIDKFRIDNEGAEHDSGLNSLDSDHFSSVETLIGYTFANKALLRTALTHSTAQIGLQTYERLEFLGDAIIDIIVKEKLWRSPLDMSEGQMTVRHASLVNKDIFAFITTKLAMEREINEVHVDSKTKQVILTPKKQRVCLHDFMLSSGDREFIEQRERFMERFTAINEQLERELVTSKEFPWTDLYRLNAPKWCSDILESIVGAVYIDSGGSLQSCETVLASTELIRLIPRAITESDVIYRQPLVRLRILNPHILVQNTKRRETRSGPLVFDCRLSLGEEELGTYTCAYSQAEAENMAANIVLRKIEGGELCLERRPPKEVTEEDDEY